MFCFRVVITCVDRSWRMQELCAAVYGAANRTGVAMLPNGP